MVALGPSYRSRVKTSDVVQSAGEGVEQIQSFFELFLPQLFYAILAPITLFAVIAPINMPAAVTMLVCAPLIIIVTGIVSMTAARAFKKYWGRYTDMGAAFLDNLQGLETLKNFDADDRAAAEMDKKAEGFRVMTMRVLQIQLRSLTAMDIVAYGGAAAGIGCGSMAVCAYRRGRRRSQRRRLVSDYARRPPARCVRLPGLRPAIPDPVRGGLPAHPTGLLLIVLLSAEFFIPMRQLGSYFHVAMNGMTSTKRIFALLDTPEPAHGTATLPATAGTDAGTMPVPRPVPRPMAESPSASTTSAIPMTARDSGAAVTTNEFRRRHLRSPTSPSPPTPVNSPPSSASPVPANPRPPRCLPVR